MSSLPTPEHIRRSIQIQRAVFGCYLPSTVRAENAAFNLKGYVRTSGLEAPVRYLPLTYWTLVHLSSSSGPTQNFMRDDEYTSPRNFPKHLCSRKEECMNRKLSFVGIAAAAMLWGGLNPVSAQQPQKPNIILILSDDFGYGDSSPYGGGPGRGMPTPEIERLANEGMTFSSFYAQPSCTPGRAAVQTGRIPNRSGMTTVAFQGQGGGLPAAEWTLGSVLKTTGYKTFFTGKWHLGEADYALPNAQGYDEMKYAFLYHLNAYTYGDPKWFPEMPATLRDMFQRVTKGALSGNAGQPPREEFKVNGEYVDTPQQGVVGIPYLDAYVERAALDYLDRNARSTQPFFMSINFMKVHQPNLPHPDFIDKSMVKSKYGDSLVEADTRIGHVMDKVRALGLDKNSYVFSTTENGAWQDVYPDAGYTQ